MKTEEFKEISNVVPKKRFFNVIKAATKKKLPKIIIFCVAILLVLGIGYYVVKIRGASSGEAATERTATAQIEDLSTTITGSGPIISANKVDISAKTSGTITKLYYKQGDKIKAGALIASIDPTNALSNVQNAQNNLEQTQLMQDSNLSDQSSLITKAPINGQITNIAVNEGDTIQKNGIIYTITDTKNMKLTVPFNGNDIKKIKVGNIVEVNLQNVMQSISGKVTYVSNAPYSTSTGGELYNVEISISNPGSLSDGLKASVNMNLKNETISSADVGTLTYINKINVRSQAGGTVEKINSKLYQYVKRGEIVMNLSNPDLATSIQTTALKIEGLKQQLVNAKTQLGYCNITSPINGTVTEVLFKEGETLTQGSVLTSVTDTSHMVFQIPVDELEIAKVKVGQNVNITMDALTETSTLPLTGKVKVVAVEGTSSNGVTSYNVTVEITGVTDPRTLLAGLGRSNNSNSNRNSYGQGNSGGNGSGNSSNNSSGFGGFTRRQGNGTGTGGFSGMSGANGGFTRGAGRFNTTDLLSSLKDGMNANAEILITENKGALTVPLEAITRVGRNNYVMVKSDEKTVAALKKSGKYIDVFNSATTASGSNSSSGSTNGTGRNRNNNNQSSSSLSSSRNTLKQNEAYYKNAIPTLVEVGANNTTSMQITSGLKTGQVVLLPPLVAGSSSSSSTRTGSGLGGMLGGGAGGLGGGQFTRNSGNGGNATRSGNGANRSGSGGGN